MLLRRSARSSKRRAALLLTVALCAFAMPASASPMPQGFTAKLEATMNGIVAADLAPSVSVAIVRSGNVAFNSAVGFSNVAGHVSATTRTLYHVGSITKLFTAVAVMQLVQRGKLSLSDSLAQFYPNFPNARQITVADLLLHRSGIANYLDDAINDGAVDEPTSDQAIVASVAKLAPLSTPGTAYAYSNTNYVLLGLIVEQISKMPLRAYYVTRIFDVAGMHSTYVGSAPAGAAVAVGYDANSNSVANPGDPSWYFGCGDILSTADDLARFDVALMQGRLLSKPLFSSMTAAALPTGAGYGYGYGIMTFPFGSDVIEGHHGGLPGFESDNEMIVAKDFAVVALGNGFAFPTSRINAAVLSALYPANYARMVADQQASAASAAAAAAPLTLRFTKLVTDIVNGNTPTGLSSAMAAALTPAALAQLRSSYASDGTFEELKYVSQDVVQQYHRYHYVAVFSKKSIPMMFVVDSSGDIAGFFNASS